MPVQKSVNPLARLGDAVNKAVKAHASDITDPGIMRLPPGIVGGIAQLTVCEFRPALKTGPYKGKPYFHAEGVMVSPTDITVNGVPVRVAGLMTTFNETLCDTKDSKGKPVPVSEHIGNVMNQMRLLAGDDEYTSSAETMEDLMRLAEELVESAPYFRVTTEAGTPSKAYPNPKTWERWQGSKGLEDWSPPDTGNGDVDQTEKTEKTPSKSKVKSKPSRNGGPVKSTAKSTTKTASTREEPEDADDEQDESPDFNDLDSLAERADAGDEDAASTIADMAEQRGIELQDDGSTWADIVAMIKDEGDEEAEEAEEAEEEPEEEQEVSGPAKGDVGMYAPPNPKGKGRLKSVKCQVVSTDEDNGTADLKNLATKKVYMKVPWDEIQGLE